MSFLGKIFNKGPKPIIAKSHEGNLDSLRCNDTVYDPEVSVTIRRMGNLVMAVPFCDLKKGDETISSEYPQFTCGDDAHISGDSSYGGYVVFDTEGNSYFPEDFGAALVANS